MRTPESIKRLYDDLTQITSTTIVIPRSSKLLQHYKEQAKTFLNEELGFKISYPDGWAINAEALEIANRQIPLLLRDVSLCILIHPENRDILHPNIFLIKENIEQADFLSYFNQHLNDLKKAGIKVTYRSDEQFKLFTVNLNQLDQDGSQLFHMQKYYVHDGQVYNIIIYGVRPETLKKEPKLNDSIKRIIQSFTFIESHATMVLNCP
jgi:hypothetical protein